jgi:DNA-directed RNA polymerase subunit M/transcription elongation factor TFIIS
MDDYTAACIKHLQERDPRRLEGYLNRWGLTLESLMEQTPPDPGKIKGEEEERGGPFSCPGCQGSEVEYREIQARSADEGATIVYLCKRCGHRWRG